eukprot:TRINITY_DN10488_c0_g1_i1.p1 TRINITY_DN10488_c0_g1~~TRINITY_DN10488_c0_g1_i1.p1  ORF type:complete len:283 (+),score=51.30 TRINITY_DN10488_c0_g1_i1:41-850(+)
MSDGASSGIIYALVARETVILAEYKSRTGNYTTVVNRLLEKIPTQDAKMSYVFERHYFHYIVSDGITFLCMADEAFKRRIPFAFLEDIQKRFFSTYKSKDIKAAQPYAMNTDFSRILQRQMEYFSNDANADRIKKVHHTLGEVKSIMVQNIEKVLERGEKIELLVDKTENLNKDAHTFKQKSVQLKRAMWWKNIKLMVILVIIVLVVIYVIIAIACKGPALPGCIKDSPKGPSAPPTHHPSNPPTQLPTFSPTLTSAPSSSPSSIPSIP